MGRISSHSAGISIALFVLLVACTPLVNSAPVQETSVSRHSSGKGCYYMNQLYPSGERIQTNEPCLNCTCVDSTFMCYLRVCPFVKPVDEHCVSEMHVGDCCPKFWCPEVYPRVTTQRPDTEPRGCVVDGRYYDEGARIPMDPLKPCEACYCIRNTSVCTMQKCELQVDGCFPQYKAGSCCPSRYNCTDQAATTIPPGIMELEDYEGCRVGDKLYKDGETVPSDNNCETCYCMKHAVACAVQKCQAPADGCTPGETEPGQCCPTKYECPLTTEVPEWYSTLSPIEEDSTSNISLTTGTEHKPTATELRAIDIGSTLFTEQDAEISSVFVTTPIELSTEDLLRGVTDSQEVADTSRITEMPKITEISELTEKADILKTSDIPETARTTVTLEVSEATKAKETSDVEETTEVKAVSDVTETSKITESTETLKVKDLSDETVTSNVTETSEATTASVLTTEPSTLSDIDEISTSSQNITVPTLDVVSRSREPKITEVPDDFFSSTTSRPVFFPSRPGEGIPGEGTCRHGNRTYKPKEKVASLDPCRKNCMCVNSVWRCEIFEECVVSTRKNCKIIPVEGECCPKYVCADEESTREPTSPKEDLKTTAPERQTTASESKTSLETEFTKSTTLSMQEEVSLDAESFTELSTKLGEEVVTVTGTPLTDIENRVQVSTVDQVTTIESEETSVDKLESVTTPPTEQKVSLAAEDITKSTSQLSTEYTTTESPSSTGTTKEQETPSSTIKTPDEKSGVEEHMDTTVSISTEQAAEEVTELTPKDIISVTFTESPAEFETTKEPIEEVTSSKPTEEIQETDIASTTFESSTSGVSEIKFTTEISVTTDSHETSQSTSTVIPTKDEKTTLLDSEQIETKATSKSTIKEELVTTTSEPKTAQPTIDDATEVTIKEFISTVNTSNESTLITKPVVEITEHRTTLEEKSVEKTTEVSATKTTPITIPSEDESLSTETHVSTKSIQIDFETTTSKPVITTDQDSLEDEKFDDITLSTTHTDVDSVASEDSKISTDEYSTTVSPLRISTGISQEAETAKMSSQDKEITTTTAQILDKEASTEISDLLNETEKSKFTTPTTTVGSIKDTPSTSKAGTDETEISHRVTEDSDQVKKTEIVTTSAPLTSEDLVTQAVTSPTLEFTTLTSDIHFTESPLERQTMPSTSHTEEEKKTSLISEIESTTFETTKAEQEIKVTTLSSDTKITTLEAETTPSTKEISAFEDLKTTGSFKDITSTATTTEYSTTQSPIISEFAPTSEQETTHISEVTVTTQAQENVTGDIDKLKISNITEQTIESTISPDIKTESKFDETSRETVEMEAVTLSTEATKTSPSILDTSLTTSKITDQESETTSSSHSVESEVTTFLSIDDSTTSSKTMETSSLVSDHTTLSTIPSTTAPITAESDAGVSEKETSEKELETKAVTTSVFQEEETTESIKAIAPDLKLTTLIEDFTVVTVTDSSPKEEFVIASLNRTEEGEKDTTLDKKITESIETDDIEPSSTVSTPTEKSTSSPTVSMSTISDTFEDDKTEISPSSTETPSTIPKQEQQTSSSQTLETEVIKIDSTTEGKEITISSKLPTKIDETTETLIKTFTTVTQPSISNMTETFSEVKTTQTESDKLTPSTVSDQEQTEGIKIVSESDSILPRIPISTDSFETSSVSGITETMESETETIGETTKKSEELSTPFSKTMITELVTSKPESTLFDEVKTQETLKALTTPGLETTSDIQETSTFVSSKQDTFEITEEFKPSSITTDFTTEKVPVTDELKTALTLKEELPTLTTETIKSEVIKTTTSHIIEIDTSTTPPAFITDAMEEKSIQTLTSKITEPEEDTVVTDSTTISVSDDEKTLFETSTKRETVIALQTTERTPITIAEEDASQSSLVTTASEITDDIGKLTTHQDVTTSVSELFSKEKTTSKLPSTTEKEQTEKETTVFAVDSLLSTTLKGLTETGITDISEMEGESITAQTSTLAEEVELLSKKTTLVEDSTTESKTVILDENIVTKSTEYSPTQSTSSDKTTTLTVKDSAISSTTVEFKDESSIETDDATHDSSITEVVTPKFTLVTREPTEIDTLKTEVTSERTTVEIAQEPKTTVKTTIDDNTFAPEEVKMLEITQDRSSLITKTIEVTGAIDFSTPKGVVQKETTSEPFTTKVSEDTKTVATTLKDSTVLEEKETSETERITSTGSSDVSTLEAETSSFTEKSISMDADKISILPELITTVTSITSTADLLETKFKLTTVEEAEPTSESVRTKIVSIPVTIETFEEEKTPLEFSTEASITETFEPPSGRTTTIKDTLEDKTELASTSTDLVTGTPSSKEITTKAIGITSTEQIKTTSTKPSETTTTKSVETTTKVFEATSNKSIETTSVKSNETSSTEQLKTTVPSSEFTSEKTDTIFELTTERSMSPITDFEKETSEASDDTSNEIFESKFITSKTTDSETKVPVIVSELTTSGSIFTEKGTISTTHATEKEKEQENILETTTIQTMESVETSSETSEFDVTKEAASTETLLDKTQTLISLTSGPEGDTETSFTRDESSPEATTLIESKTTLTEGLPVKISTGITKADEEIMLQKSTTFAPTISETTTFDSKKTSEIELTTLTVLDAEVSTMTSESETDFKTPSSIKTTSEKELEVTSDATAITKDDSVKHLAIDEIISTPTTEKHDLEMTDISVVSEDAIVSNVTFGIDSMVLTHSTTVIPITTVHTEKGVITDTEPVTSTTLKVASTPQPFEIDIDRKGLKEESTLIEITSTEQTMKPTSEITTKLGEDETQSEVTISSKTTQSQTTFEESKETDVVTTTSEKPKTTQETITQPQTLGTTATKLVTVEVTRTDDITDDIAKSEFSTVLDTESTARTKTTKEEFSTVTTPQEIEISPKKATETDKEKLTTVTDASESISEETTVSESLTTELTSAKSEKSTVTSASETTLEITTSPTRTASSETVEFVIKTSTQQPSIEVHEESTVEELTSKATELTIPELIFTSTTQESETVKQKISITQLIDTEAPKQTTTQAATTEEPKQTTILITKKEESKEPTITVAEESEILTTQAVKLEESELSTTQAVTVEESELSTTQATKEEESELSTTQAAKVEESEQSTTVTVKMVELEQSTTQLIDTVAPKQSTTETSETDKSKLSTTQFDDIEEKEKTTTQASETEKSEELTVQEGEADKSIQSTTQAFATIEHLAGDDTTTKSPAETIKTHLPTLGGELETEQVTLPEIVSTVKEHLTLSTEKSTFTEGLTEKLTEATKSSEALSTTMLVPEEKHLSSMEEERTTFAIQSTTTSQTIELAAETSKAPISESTSITDGTINTLATTILSKKTESTESSTEENLEEITESISTSKLKEREETMKETTESLTTTKPVVTTEPVSAVTESTSSTATTTTESVTKTTAHVPDVELTTIQEAEIKFTTEKTLEISTIEADSEKKDECIVNGTSYGDGIPIRTIEPCERCHCAAGEIVCFKIICKLPLKGCIAETFFADECCPSTYKCPADDGSLSTISFNDTQIATEKDFTTPIPISFMLSTTPTAITSTKLVTISDETLPTESAELFTKVTEESLSSLGETTDFTETSESTKVTETSRTTSDDSVMTSEQIRKITTDVSEISSSTKEISTTTESKLPITTPSVTSTETLVPEDSTTAKDEDVSVGVDFRSTITETSLTTLADKPSVTATSEIITETLLSRSGITQASTSSVTADIVKVITTLVPTEPVTTDLPEKESSTDNISFDTVQTSSQTEDSETSTFEAEKTTTTIAPITITEDLDITTSEKETSKAEEQKITTVGLESIDTSTVTTLDAETIVTDKSVEVSSMDSTKAADITLVTSTPAKLPKIEDTDTTTMKTTIEDSITEKERIFSTEKVTTEEIEKPTVQESTTFGSLEKGTETLSTFGDKSAVTSVQPDTTTSDEFTTIFSLETTTISESASTFVESSSESSISLSISTDKTVTGDLQTTKLPVDTTTNLISTAFEINEVPSSSIETQESSEKATQTTSETLSTDISSSVKPEDTPLPKTVTEEIETIRTTPSVEQDKTTTSIDFETVSTSVPKTTISEDEQKELITAEKEQSITPLTTSQRTITTEDLEGTTKLVTTSLPKTTSDDDKISKPEELFAKETISDTVSTATTSGDLHTITQEGETTESFESFTETIETNKTISSLSKEGTTISETITDATSDSTDRLSSTTKEPLSIQPQTQPSIEETKSTDTIFKFVTTRFTDKEEETTISEKFTKTTVFTPSQLFTITPKTVLTTKGPSIKSLDTDSPFMQESTITQSVVTQEDALVSQSITFPEITEEEISEEDKLSGNDTEKSDEFSSTLEVDKELTASTMPPKRIQFTTTSKSTTPEDVLSTKQDEESSTVTTELVTESVSIHKITETEAEDTTNLSSTTKSDLVSTSSQMSLSLETSSTQKPETTDEEKTTFSIDASTAKEMLPKSILVTDDVLQQTTSKALDEENTTKIDLESLSLTTLDSQLDEEASQKEITSTVATDITKFATESITSSISDSTTNVPSPVTTSIVKVNETSDSPFSTQSSTTVSESSTQKIQLSESTVSKEETSKLPETTEADIKIITEKILTTTKEDATAISIQSTVESETTLSSIIPTVTVPSIALGPSKIKTTTEENVSNITEPSETVTEVSTERVTKLPTKDASEPSTELVTEVSRIRETELTTEMIVDVSTEQAAEPTTERVAEAFTAQATEKSTAQPTDPTTVKVAEASTALPTKPSTEGTIKEFTAQPTEPATERAVEASTAQATESTTEKDVKISTAQPTESTTKSVVEASTAQATEPTTEKAVEAFTAQATEPTTEKAVKVSTTKPTEPTTEKAVEVSTAQDTKPTTEGVLEGSTKTSTDASIEKAAEASTEESIDVLTKGISESSEGMSLLSTVQDSSASTGIPEQFAEETSSSKKPTEETIADSTGILNVTEVPAKTTTEPIAEKRIHETTTQSPTKRVTEMLTKAYKGIETTPTVPTTVSDNATATDAEEDFLLDEGVCIFEGQIYHSAEQIVREDPCEFCFCFRGDIICLQQSCPPPAPNCHQTLIKGYCCPRYDCPVLVTSRNLTNFTRRKGVQPIIIQKRIEKRAARAAVEIKGCQINGTFYAVGSTVAKASGPCLHCSCEEGGNMRCDPIKCKPQAPLMLKMNNQFFRHR